MAKKYVTNGDRILQAVLADEDLIRFGEYNPAEYNDLNIALYSNLSLIHISEPTRRS